MIIEDSEYVIRSLAHKYFEYLRFCLKREGLTEFTGIPVYSHDYAIQNDLNRITYVTSKSLKARYQLYRPDLVFLGDSYLPDSLSCEQISYRSEHGVDKLIYVLRFGKNSVEISDELFDAVKTGITEWIHRERTKLSIPVEIRIVKKGGRIDRPEDWLDTACFIVEPKEVTA